jgi:6-pyruvoyltetrahydropterin/6-carboxytetrahydropterin synthase
VNPAQIKRQVSGSFVYGLSALFEEECTVKDGRIEQKNFDTFGKCSNPNWHGHNYEILVTVKGEPDAETGFLFDVKKLSQLINKYVIDEIDHKNLNIDVPFMQGQMCSTENLVIAIWKQLEPHIPAQVKLHCIKLYETPRIYVEYFGA